MKVLLAFLLVSTSGSLSAQTQGGGPPPGSREAMWPAPTKEDWAKPCAIRWQRTWEDAVAVSKEMRRPILVCVNMDGEIASEHYAGIRYRQPEIAVLYEPYVTVIASVYRHTPRDYDENGTRIPCPRFGTVTCGEHIALEPLVYERFLDGQRVAPRHIMIELDGKETYDVFYAFDTDSVFERIRKGIEERPEKIPPRLEDARTTVERVTSHDSADREEVEAAWVKGDKTVRRQLLRAAVTQKTVSQADLLRLALFGGDEELAGSAWTGLLASDSPSSIDLLVEALRFPLAEKDRIQLIETLERIGQNSPRAKRLAKVQRGLLARGKSSREGEAAAADLEIPKEELVRRRLEESASDASLNPADGESRIRMAEQFITLARHPDTPNEYRSLYYEDAKSAATQADEMDAPSWRVHTVLALVAQQSGTYREAADHAVAAIEQTPPGTYSPNHIAVLSIYVRVRYRQIARAVNREREWPTEWLAEIDAAYDTLVHHPEGTAIQVLDHYTLLNALEAKTDAAQVLDRGLKRFTDSWELHAKLRERLLADTSLNGLRGLESHYDMLLAESSASPYIHWFAGYASIVAAEYHRRSNKDSQAVEAYNRGIADFEKCIELAAETRATADHYIALAIAGRARLAMERGDLELAFDEIRASFERDPNAAASLDGLNLSPVATAQMLRSKLREAGLEDLAQGIQASLDSLDPKMLEPAEFDRVPR